MTWAVIVNLAIGLTAPPLSGVMWAPFEHWLDRRRGKPRQTLREIVVSGWVPVAIILTEFWAVREIWSLVIGGAASAVIGAAVWWWRRKKRRSVTALLGAKAKALRDALVRRAREATPKPRRVLRPVPGGAR